MLFVAVFLGSLGEYALEHKIESERTEQLARNLYEELQANDAALQRVLQIRERKEQWISDFSHDVATVDLQQPPLPFYISFTGAFLVTTPTIFEPSDGVLEQLISSGSLRYFRDPRIQTQIGDLKVATAAVRARQLREAGLVETTLRNFYLRHFDMPWLALLTDDFRAVLLDAISSPDTAKVRPPRILNAKSFDREEAQNIGNQTLLMYRSTRNLQLRQYRAANEQLLQSLRENYHFE